MEGIRRSILEKLIRRLAGSDHPLANLRVEPPTESNTDRFDRVLALWIDLHRAVMARSEHVNRPNGCSPWNCPDPRVRAAWQALTSPKYVHALENLFYQMPEGAQMELARKALQVCRERQKPD